MLSKHLQQHIIFCLTSSLQKDIALQNIQRVHGGDINKTFLLETTAGKFFLKVNDNVLPGMFEKESSGLALLKSSACLDVPLPLVTGNFGQSNFLVMEWMEKGRPAVDFWQQFGHRLASLHRQTQRYFGLGEDNYIGSIPQLNTASATWAGFYADRRIITLMLKALAQHKCSVADVRAAEKLCYKLDGQFPEETPALLHGDLWSGNFLVGEKGQPVIYDPAVYYGNREMDIAMTLLFGGFDKQFYYHYNEAWPLLPGWQQRVPLCQLHPLLVHLLLFGGHYYASVMKVINSYL